MGSARAYLRSLVSERLWKIAPCPSVWPDSSRRGIRRADCSACNVSPCGSQWTNRVARRFLPGDTWAYRVQLLCGSDPVHSNPPLGLGARRLVCSAGRVMRLLHSRMDRVSSALASLRLAVWQWRVVLHHHGRCNHIFHLSLAATRSHASAVDVSGC